MRQRTRRTIFTFREATHFAQTILGSAQGDANRIARDLFAAILRRTPAWVLAHPEANLGFLQAWQFRSLVRKLGGGYPLAYVLRQEYFLDQTLSVGPGVLIPRPETEALVIRMAEYLAQDQPGTLLDLGTGSGCIAIGLARQLPAWRVLGLDCSKQALRYASRNLKASGCRNMALVRGNFREASYLRGMKGISAIISNPPYVAHFDFVRLSGLHFEPRLALDGGRDGLDAIRDVIAEAECCLPSQGWLAFEFGIGQYMAIQRLVAKRFRVQEFLFDFQGIPRHAILRKH